MTRLRVAARKRSNRGLALWLLGFLIAALLLAHGPLGMGHDSEMSDHAMEDALTTCLAIVGIAGAGLLLAAVRREGWRYRREVATMRTSTIVGVLSTSRLAGSARAGPASLQVFRL